MQMTMEEFYPVRAVTADGAVVYAANNSLRLLPLPARRFCSGHTFFVQMSGKVETSTCLNVHVTFTEGGVHGKLWRLKEAGLWSLEPPAYWGVEDEKFLTIEPPMIPLPYPPARIEPFSACERRRAEGKPTPAAFYGWLSPPGAGVTYCAKDVAQYDDHNGDRGVTIEEVSNRICIVS